MGGQLRKLAVVLVVLHLMLDGVLAHLAAAAVLSATSSETSFETSTATILPIQTKTEPAPLLIDQETIKTLRTSENNDTTTNNSNSSINISNITDKRTSPPLSNVDIAADGDGDLPAIAVILPHVSTWLQNVIRAWVRARSSVIRKMSTMASNTTALVESSMSTALSSKENDSTLGAYIAALMIGGAFGMILLIVTSFIGCRDDTPAHYQCHMWPWANTKWSVLGQSQDEFAASSFGYDMNQYVAKTTEKSDKMRFRFWRDMNTAELKRSLGHLSMAQDWMQSMAQDVNNALFQLKTKLPFYPQEVINGEFKMRYKKALFALEMAGLNTWKSAYVNDQVMFAIVPYLAESPVQIHELSMKLSLKHPELSHMFQPHILVGMFLNAGYVQETSGVSFDTVFATTTSICAKRLVNLFWTAYHMNQNHGHRAGEFPKSRSCIPWDLGFKEFPLFDSNAAADYFGPTGLNVDNLIQEVANVRAVGKECVPWKVLHTIIEGHISRTFASLPHADFLQLSIKLLRFELEEASAFEFQAVPQTWGSRFDIESSTCTSVIESHSQEKILPSTCPFAPATGANEQAIVSALWWTIVGGKLSVGVPNFPEVPDALEEVQTSSPVNYPISELAKIFSTFDSPELSADPGPNFPEFPNIPPPGAADILHTRAFPCDLQRIRNAISIINYVPPATVPPTPFKKDQRSFFFEMIPRILPCCAGFNELMQRMRPDMNQFPVAFEIGPQFTSEMTFVPSPLNFLSTFNVFSRTSPLATDMCALEMRELADAVLAAKKK